MYGDRLIWGAVGAAALVVFLMAIARFSPSARLRRRLRKTHSRIASKAHEPAVKFSVKPPKE
jgi:hypothetical protein